MQLLVSPRLKIVVNALLMALPVALSIVLFQAIDARADEIRSFNQDVHLLEEASLDVKETIVMDLVGSIRPAFYRIIPVEYQAFGKSYRLDVRVVSVSDKSGKLLDYTQTRLGRTLSIRIARPYQEMSGEHVFCLHYIVRRAVNFYHHPELCWNATGDAWPFAIRQATVSITLPSGIKTANLNILGFAGNAFDLRSAQILLGDSKQDTIAFNAQNIKPGQGLTILIGLPQGAVAPAGWAKQLGWFFADWWLALFIPLLTLTGIAGAWWICARDRRPAQAVHIQMDLLTGLSPAEVGALIDEKCALHNITSTLVDLAARGVIRIEEIEGNGFLSLSNKDYLFSRNNGGSATDLAPHERLLLTALFHESSEGRKESSNKVKLSSLQGKFSQALPTIKQAVYASLINKGQLRCYPQDVEKSCHALGFAISLIGVAIFFAFGKGSYVWQAASIGLIISGLLILLFAPFMRARTVFGAQLLGRLRAFQTFMLISENSRIRLLAKNDPSAFVRLLPYTMVLGVADKWAEAFQDLIKEAPNWYKPYIDEAHGEKFSSQAFVSELGSGMRTVERILTS
jgi:hypothetical protein